MAFYGVQGYPAVLHPVGSFPADEATLLLDALESSFGLDRQLLCREARIDWHRLDDQLYRVPAGAFLRLFDLAEHWCGEPQIGLQAAARTGLRTFSSYMFRAQPTLRAAIERALELQTALLGAVSLRLRTSDGVTALIVVESVDTPGSRHFVEYLFGRLQRTLRVSTRPAARPECIHLRHDCVGPRAEYERILGGPILFRQREHAALFLERDLDRSMRDANAFVAAQLEKSMRQQIELCREPALRNRVRALIREALFGRARCEREQIAAALAVSVRTLVRHLAREGATFRQVSEEARRELALELIQDLTVSVYELSERCGFADPASFDRAFRRWTGASPTAYRHRALVTQPVAGARDVG